MNYKSGEQVQLLDKVIINGTAEGLVSAFDKTSDGTIEAKVCVDSMWSNSGKKYIYVTSEEMQKAI